MSRLFRIRTPAGGRSFSCAVLLLAAAGCLVGGPAGAQSKDEPGSADHPLVGRYEGARITRYKKVDFDETKVLAGRWDPRAPDKGESALRELTGRTTTFVYELPTDRSALEIMTNWSDSLKSKGFATEFECKDDACAPFQDSNGGATGFAYRLADRISEGVPAVYNLSSKHVRYFLGRKTTPQADVYASLFIGDNGAKAAAFLRVVEVKPMQTDKIVFVDAGAMKSALTKDGRVSLYGVYFDTDKDQPTPQSKPTLDEIAKLLKDDPGLNLIVTGHTDNQGAFDYNVDLSRRRAANIAAALSRDYGAAGARLQPFGAGMAAPAAANDNEAGRAKNRRVELVRR